MSSKPEAQRAMRAARARVSGLLVACREAEERAGCRFPTLADALLDLSADLDLAVEGLDQRDQDVSDLVQSAGRMVEESDRNARADRSVVAETLAKVIAAARDGLAQLSDPICDPVELEPLSQIQNAGPNVVPFPGRSEGGVA